MDTESWVFVGLALSVTSTTFSVFGQNVQKHAFITAAKSQTGGENSKPNQYKLWRWWCGLGLTVVGALFDFAALKFAPQSVIMPAGAISLGINPLFASLWLGEKFSLNDVYGTLLVIAGAAGVACAYAVLGSPTEKIYTLEELLALYARPVMLGYGLSILLLVRFLMNLLARCERLRDQSLTRSTKQADDSKRYSDVQHWHPIAFGALSGIFGAQSVLFAKSTVELIGTSIQGNNQFANPFAFGVVACMLLAITGQTHFLSEGLKHFDALIIVPVFQFFLITFSILGGATYFGDLYGFTAQQWLCFVVSLSTAMVGVRVLSQRQCTDEAATAAEEYGDVGCAEYDCEKGRMLTPEIISSPEALRCQELPPLHRHNDPEIGTLAAGDQQASRQGSTANDLQATQQTTVPFVSLWADGIVVQRQKNDSPNSHGHVVHV